MRKVWTLNIYFVKIGFTMRLGILILFSVLGTLFGWGVAAYLFQAGGVSGIGRLFLLFWAALMVIGGVSGALAALTLVDRSRIPRK